MGNREGLGNHKGLPLRGYPTDAGLGFFRGFWNLFRGAWVWRAFKWNTPDGGLNCDSWDQGIGGMGIILVNWDDPGAWRHCGTEIWDRQRVQ